MNCLCQPAIVVLPALLLLLCLGYVHQRARATWRKEVVFWISVLVAFVTVFVFVSLVQLSGPRDPTASLQATLLSTHAPPLLLIWWGALGLGSAGAVACVIHRFVRPPS
jgi:lipopolysaccharide export LptBFGC system permease protein LptF